MLDLGLQESHHQQLYLGRLSLVAARVDLEHQHKALHQYRHQEHTKDEQIQSRGYVSKCLRALVKHYGPRFVK